MSDSLQPHGLQHARLTCPSLTSRLLKLMSIKLVMPSSHLVICNSLLLVPSIFPRIKVLSNESALCIRWLKCWSFIFSISLSNQYSRLIFFRIDWLDFLTLQRTHNSLLQHHSSKASILFLNIIEPNLLMFTLQENIDRKSEEKNKRERERERETSPYFLVCYYISSTP